MLLADFLGWNSQDWTDTIGLLVVFAIATPLLLQGLIIFTAVQARGEKAEDAKHAGRWGVPDDEDG